MITNLEFSPAGSKNGNTKSGTSSLDWHDVWELHSCGIMWDLSQTESWHQPMSVAACADTGSVDTRGQQMDNSQSPNIGQSAGLSFCSEQGRDTHCSRGGVLTNKRKQHNVTVETEEERGRWRVSIQWLKITGYNWLRRRVHCPSLNKTIRIIFSFSTLIPDVALQWQCCSLTRSGHVSPLVGSTKIWSKRLSKITSFSNS